MDVMNEQTVRDGYAALTRHLIRTKQTITTMESATSGQIASLITDTEGSSEIFKGAFITYSNEAKIRQGVPAETIRTYGVYSAETAEEMARASRQAFDTDIAIGVTGTMGNVDPANHDSIPGQVYFCIDFHGTSHEFYRELPSQPTRLMYKLAVAGEVLKELNQLLETEGTVLFDSL